jgi:hypothetical protein
VWRHYSAKSRRRSPVIVLSVLLVVTLVGWGAYDYLADRIGASGCDTTVDSAGTCYEVRVSEEESVLTAESLVSGGTERLDVWLPESTVWLRRSQARGAWDVLVSGTYRPAPRRRAARPARASSRPGCAPTHVASHALDHAVGDHQCSSPNPRTALWK